MAHGFPVWVGGTHTRVRALAAAEADGWNFWGSDLPAFAMQASAVRVAAARTPFTISWGGLVVVAASDGEAATKAECLSAAPSTLVGGPERIAAALRDLAARGAEWAILGPIDSSDPDNAALLGASVLPLVRGVSTARNGGGPARSD